MVTQVDYTDALILGAGPVGLLMASELARHGVSSLLVDDSETPQEDSRQLIIHPCTRAMLADIGILDELLEKSQPLQHIRCYVNRELYHMVDLENDAHLRPLIVEEQEVTRLLREYLMMLGITIHPYLPLLEHNNTESGVIASLGTDEETLRVQAQWSIDTRKHTYESNLHNSDNFYCLNYLSPLLVVDALMDWDLPPTETVVFASDDVVAICLPSIHPGREHWLIYAPAAFQSIDAAPDEAMIEEVLSQVVPFPFQLNTLLHAGWKPLHAHLAREYRQGGSFLVGQAACSHPSLLGQELHLGLQDAYNLAWKLGLVARGEACSTLLETYHVERSFLGQEWWDQSDPLFRRTFLSPSLAHSSSLDTFTKKEVLFQLFRPLLRPLQQDYVNSPIVREKCCRGLMKNRWEAGPQPGERAPDGLLVLHGGSTATLYERCWGAHHTLLVFEGLDQTEVESDVLSFAQELQFRYGDLLHVKVLCHSPSDNLSMEEEFYTTLDPEGRLHHAYGALKPCLYLLRPDGYIGFRALPVDEESFENYWQHLTHPLCHLALS
jgi:2-polyprenyl-6-methoxyphenol hydroxylase-like FAD-dependent oxidoreductase